MPRLNFPSVFWSMAFAMLFFSYIFFSGCEKTNNPVNSNPNGTLVKYSDCKNAVLSDSTSNNFDCIEYSYDNDRGVLKLKHINAGFNCCPAKITAAISINNDAVIIIEKEQEAGCHCNCLFDIDYEIKNLSSFSFRIMVVEPYRPVEEQVLEFDVDLKSQPSGRFCVERSNYPWNMK
ncbi:MAG: hypothetical protein M1419_00840 [Bacteroidetes bacterium]|nr:hypothetical protein [Bacteroidota bacterium]